ncbi:hypothetical protein [Pseudofrankia inefficax]|uniref:hypothetical protein n=1 Tax=Pseudofrankia inefficax (strain DSM 45817 / CECT 9037 / DDB 130130 / EuI1c) TaxID=298654 RepID=UPI0001BFA2F7|nr:hypothetical protein [Pseudofrankia inefficax]
MDEALAAYRAMFEDWIAVSATSDYQNPRLTEHVSGRALSLLYQSVYLDKQHGLVVKGRPVLVPSVTALGPEPDPSRATIVDCADDTNWLDYRLDGQLQDDTPGGRHFVQALALRTDSTWKIDQLVIKDRGTC